MLASHGGSVLYAVFLRDAASVNIFTSAASHNTNYVVAKVASNRGDISVIAWSISNEVGGNSMGEVNAAITDEAC